MRAGVLLAAVAILATVVINMVNGPSAQVRTAALAVPPLTQSSRTEPSPSPTPTPSPTAVQTPDPSTKSSPERPSYDAGRLDPDLEKAFGRARKAAKADGVSVSIRTGYRSAKRQQDLFENEIAATGSRKAALKRVLPAKSSMHVRGGAIDVKPQAGATWLEKNGSEWGLCRRYENEWWHFELMIDPGGTCPTMEPQPKE
ncbi:MAG: D-alanyl-D-alanine carboxypeptidase family protein [Propionibacteriales bacterium]|nr:D-alanyl-D-alanine carboxypeptidase family protein [Propionibacteriales bacterium]